MLPIYFSARCIVWAFSSLCTRKEAIPVRRNQNKSSEDPLLSNVI